jgi:predicted sugar kinase
MKNKKQLNEELKGLGTSLKVLLEELQQLHDIIMVTIRGLSLTQEIPKAMEALTTINRVLGEEHENEVDREKAATEVKRVVEVARQEIDNLTGFSSQGVDQGITGGIALRRLKFRVQECLF